MSSNSLGNLSAIAGFLRPDGNYWQKKGTLTVVKETIETTQQVVETTHKVMEKTLEATEKLNKVLGNPGEFLAEAATSIMGAVTGNAEEAQGGGGTLLDRAKGVLIHGQKAGSALTLEQLLQYAETFDLDPEDKKVIEDSQKALEEAKLEEKKKKESPAENPIEGKKETKKSYSETVDEIWLRLSKYNILVGGVLVNGKKATEDKENNDQKPVLCDVRKGLEGESHNGESPTVALQKCSDSLHSLRQKHGLPSTAAEKPVLPPSKTPMKKPLSSQELSALDSLEKKTNEMVVLFAEKTTHCAVMYTINYLFSAGDATKFNQILETKGDYEQLYLKQFEDGFFSYYFYKVIYNILLWLIEPIISKTFEKMVSRVRGFLKNEVDLKKFLQDKLKEMSQFYGCIEQARQNYVLPRTELTGTFEHYLEEKFKVYDGNLTEKDLIRIFNDYIVDNFVPSPDIQIAGYHIPLISSLLEWIGYAIRKAIIRCILNKTEVTSTVLNEGANSIYYAELGLKTLLVQKMSQIAEMIEKARIESDDPEILKEKAELEERLKVQKAQIYNLHKDIELHSKKLHRFMDIEACAGDEDKLKGIDNQVQTLISSLRSTFESFLHLEIPSFEKILEDASTDIVEKAIISLLENKETQVETQLQTIFELLANSFTYVADEDRVSIEQKYRADCTLADQALQGLQAELSRSAVAASIETHLKDASLQKHRTIKAYVSKQKEVFDNFFEELNSNMETLKTLSALPKEGQEMPSAAQMKTCLGRTLTLIEGYLGNVTIQLKSSELRDCYSTVRGDLHNIFACTIATINEIHPALEAIAEKLNQMKLNEEEIARSKKCATFCQNFSLDWSLEKAKKELTALKEILPPSLKRESESEIDEMFELYKEKSSVTSGLRELNHYDLVKRKERKLLKKMESFRDLEEKIERLSLLSREYYYLGPNRKFLTTQAVKEEKKRLFPILSDLYAEIMNDPSPIAKDHLAPLLKSKDTDALYWHFNSSLFRRQIPIFAKIEKFKIFHQKKLGILTQELVKIKTETSKRSTLESRNAELANALKAKSEKLHKWVATNGKIKESDKKNSCKIVHDKMALASTVLTEELDFLKGYFVVKGCISAGEKEIYKTLEPKLTSYISSTVNKRNQALVEAMGNPFYIKQIALRTIFVPLAQQQSR